MCSVHLDQYRAHSYSHSCCSKSSYHALIIATCVFSLLLSDAPFTDRAVFSIQGQHLSHTFTVIARCRHAGIHFSLSQLANNCSTSNAAADSSALTSASKSLLLTVVTGGNAGITEDGSETPRSLTTGVFLPQVDFELG